MISSFIVFTLWLIYAKLVYLVQSSDNQLIPYAINGFILIIENNSYMQTLYCITFCIVMNSIDSFLFLFALFLSKYKKEKKKQFSSETDTIPRIDVV